MLPNSTHVKKTVFSEEIVQEFGWRNYTISTNITKYEHDSRHDHHRGHDHMSELILANQTLTVTKTESDYPYWQQEVLNISFITVNSTEALTTIFVGEDGSGQNITCTFIKQNSSYSCPNLYGENQDGIFKPVVANDAWEFIMWY
jgi:hypothetical protein